MHRLFILAVFFVLTVFGIELPALVAEESHEDHAHHEHGAESASAALSVSEPIDVKPVKRADGIIDLNNKVCLVSGKDVSGKDFHEHNGVNYSFCCKMCVRDFQKAPEKFALSQEMIDAALADSGARPS